MAKTSLDLANEALDKSNLVGLGQSPEAEDTAKAIAKFNDFRDWLDREGIYSIADPSDIETAFFNWLAEAFAGFLKMNMTEDVAAAKLEMAVRRITKMQASAPTREKLVVDYF